MEQGIEHRVLVQAKQLSFKELYESLYGGLIVTASSPIIFIILILVITLYPKYITHLNSLYFKETETGWLNHIPDLQLILSWYSDWLAYEALQILIILCNFLFIIINYYLESKVMNFCSVVDQELYSYFKN